MRHDCAKEIAEAVREATAPLQSENEWLTTENDGLRATIADLTRQLAEERDARETSLADYDACYSEQSERNRALIDTVARLDAENAERCACRTATPNPIASVVGASDEDGELVAVDFFDASGSVLGGVDVTAGKVVWSVVGGESGSMENPAMRCRTAADLQREREREAQQLRAYHATYGSQRAVREPWDDWPGKDGGIDA